MIESRRIPFTPYIAVNNGDSPPLRRIAIVSADHTAEPDADAIDRLRTALRDRIEDFHDIAEAVLEGRSDRGVLEMCELAVKRSQQTLNVTRPKQEPEGAA
jgi:hypothetical protein